ncbi:MAG: HAD family hydrolase [bacterium]
MTARHDHPIRGVLLDLDGTLTVPILDFDAMRHDIGIDGGAILEALERMSDAERRRAFRIIEQHEQRAAAASRLNPGAEELLVFVARHQLPCGLVTRNSRASVQTFIARHGAAFDVVITREDARPKPSPAPLLRALERLGLRPAESIYVGDHEIDRLTGEAAGVPTYIVRTHDTTRDHGPPERRLDRLTDLIGIIRRSWE